ncbi:MAG: NAD-dependent epimerase/dehydratase family protein, partial [bacterium]
MKALVTGGGGFLGGAIVRKLLEREDKVRALGRSRYPELEKLGVETVTADVRDREAVERAAQGMDIIFHVASKVGIWGGWKDYYQTNVAGTENVLLACRKNGISRLVYTSSPSVTYDGSDQVDIDETQPYAEKHLCNYSRSKAMAERKVLAENGRDGLWAVALRP